MNNFLNFSNSLLKMLTKSAFSFYTTWALTLFILYALGILSKFQSSIFLILLTIFVVGMIITYIHPREVEIPFLRRKIGSNLLKIYNLGAHVLPLVLFLYMYDSKIKSDNLYLAVFSLLIYVLMFNPIEVYNYKKDSNYKIVANVLLISYLLLVGILIIKQKNLF